ncbi:ABC transporter permease [Cereibacter azotoformans]|uniref:Sulfonate transport system permease protein n=1 Tax=Cereibacter azotoformans TaxID=43057 RepID=A0A2T5JT67_9RHOB|nr:ABC transporter permease [Cereibacter azotoformans]PTR12999.1 sulfonate transport system permease protein [Cereibacter azotoformans]UIJ32791.1 ABC transporter permease [Cereibacter azotoformans]
MTADTSPPARPGWLAGLRGRDHRPFVSFGIILVIWTAAHELEWVDPRFLPSPIDLLWRLVTEVQSGSLLLDLAETLKRNLGGFAIGAGVGVTLGALLGTSRLLARIVGPTVVAHRQTALFAWVPLIAMWFGGGDQGKIAFVAMAAFQPTVINTWRGIAGVPAGLQELAAALRFSRLQYLRHVALPAALPQIFTGLHAALIYAWLATVGAELFLNITPGLGGRLVEGSQLFEMDLLFLVIVIFGLVGLVYNGIAERIEARLLKWNRP